MVFIWVMSAFLGHKDRICRKVFSGLPLYRSRPAAGGAEYCGNEHKLGVFHVTLFSSLLISLTHLLLFAIPSETQLSNDVAYR